MARERLIHIIYKYYFKNNYYRERTVLLKYLKISLDTDLKINFVGSSK